MEKKDQAKSESKTQVNNSDREKRQKKQERKTALHPIARKEGVGKRKDERSS